MMLLIEDDIVILPSLVRVLSGYNSVCRGHCYITIFSQGYIVLRCQVITLCVGGIVILPSLVRVLSGYNSVCRGHCYITIFSQGIFRL